MYKIGNCVAVYIYIAHHLRGQWNSSIFRKMVLTLYLIHTLSLNLSAFYRSSNQLIHRTIKTSNHRTINPSINTSIDQSIHRSIHRLINPSIRLFIDHLIDPSIDLLIHTSIDLSIDLSIDRSIHRSMH